MGRVIRSSYKTLFIKVYKQRLININRTARKTKEISKNELKFQTKLYR